MKTTAWGTHGNILRRLVCIAVFATVLCGDWTTTAWSIDYPVWSGGSDNKWDTSTNNWGSNDTAFKTGDVANFDATGSGTVIVDDGGVEADGVYIFGNKNYTFTGGKITADNLVLGQKNLNGTAETERFSGIVDFTGLTNNPVIKALPGIELHSGGFRISSADQLGTILNRLSFEADATDSGFNDLKTAISTNTGISGAVNTVRTSGLLPTLYIDGDTTFDGENSNKHRLNITSDRAGSIHVENGTLTFENGLYTAGSGGALDAYGLTVMTAAAGAGYVFKNNIAGAGGAIYKGDYAVTLASSVFEGNEATVQFGGAIGGGVASGGTTLTLIDCSFLGNTAKRYGGAIYLLGGNFTLNTTTGISIFAGNKANGLANSIYFEGVGGFESELPITINTGADTILDMRDPMIMSNTYSNVFLPVTKKGTGVWKLGGTNEITTVNAVSTAFTVSEGTLHLYRAAEIADDDEYVIKYGNVETGKLTLTEYDFAVDSGATLSIGGGNSITTTGSLTIDNGATIAFDMTGATESAARLTLDVATNTGSIGSQTINILNTTIDDLLDTPYLLVQSANGNVNFDSTGTLKLNGVSIDTTLYTATLSQESTTDKLFLVVVKNPAPPPPTGLLAWTNTSGNAAWDITSDNWSDNPSGTATQTKFANGDDLLFDSSYATTPADRTITVAPGGVKPGDLTFTGAGDWTFSGGPIDGGKLVKGGSSTGVVTLAGQADFTGIDIHAGSVLVTGSLGANANFAAPVGIVAGASLAFDQTTNQTVSGVISGDGALEKSGSGVLTLSGTNDFTGGTGIKTGTVAATNASALGSGSVVIGGHGADAVLDMNIASPGGAALANLAGRTTLNPNAAFNINTTSDYTLTDGLSFNSAAGGSSVALNSPGRTVTLASGKDINAGSADFDLAAATTLSVVGASTLTAANSVFSGIIDLPAASSLTVTGDAVLPATGAIHVDASYATDMGKLSINGSLTVAPSASGASNIFFGPGAVGFFGQSFLTAAGGITGAENLKSDFFSFDITGNTVTLSGLKTQSQILDNLLGPASVTQNMSAAAAATNANWATLSPELQTAINRYILQLDSPGVSPALASAAFRQLYGEYATVARRSLREDATRFQSAMRGHVDRNRSSAQLRTALRSDAALASYGGYDCRPSFANHIWGGGFGSWTEQDSRKGTAGYEYKSGGLLLGYDHAITDNFVFGFAAAYTRGRTDVDDLRTRYDSDAVNAGVYAAWFGASGIYAKANAAFGYGWNDYDVNMVVGGGHKKGDYHTQAITASAEFGREFSLPCDFTFTPSFGVDFAYIRNNSWTESTTGNAVANRFASGHDTLVDIPLTARIGKVWDLGNGRYIMPEASVSYIYSAADREEKVSASYAGAPFGYNQKGVGVGRGRVRLGASVKARLTDRADAGLDYTFETRTGYRNHNLSIAVGWSF